MNQCSLAECSGKISARGYCGKHYYRFRKHGSPDITATSPHGACAVRDESGRKWCKGCSEWVEEARFGRHPQTVDGRALICQRCAAAASRFRRYGVTAEWYATTLLDQGGVCAICKIADVTLPKDGCVDHDHSCCPGGTACGRCVRGILCRRCNLLLGHAQDSSGTLRNALTYLGRFS